MTSLGSLRAISTCLPLSVPTRYLFPTKNNVQQITSLRFYRPKAPALSPEELQEKREKRNTHKRNRWHTDPEFRRKESLRHRQCYDQKYKDRLEKRRTENPDWYQEGQLQSKLRNIADRYRDDAAFRWTRILDHRVFRNHHYRQTAVWQNHEPISYPEKVQHQCATCGVQRLSSQKLWWRRKDEPEKHDCMYSICMPKMLSWPWDDLYKEKQFIRGYKVGKLAFFYV